MIHKHKLRTENRGIGMTSQGTRDRLVQTLRKEGIKDEPGPMKIQPCRSGKAKPYLNPG